MIHDFSKGSIVGPGLFFGMVPASLGPKPGLEEINRACREYNKHVASQEATPPFPCINPQLLILNIPDND